MPAAGMATLNTETYLFFLSEFRMNKQFLSSLVTAAVLGGAALGASAQNLAVVNGKPVPNERVEILKKQIERSGRPISPEIEGQIKEEVIAREIFQQEASRLGMEASPAYKTQMELARQSVLINALFEDFKSKNPVTDAEIKAEYDKFVAANQGQEYRASHILVPTENEAKAIIASLKKGGNFAEIAKKQSKDPGSGARGGDLDWANANSYVPEFTQAMVKLQKGSYTQTPVKSQFGYHVIRLDDTRQAELPKLEDVKPQVAQQLEQQKVIQFQESLRAKAKVE